MNDNFTIQFYKKIVGDRRINKLSKFINLTIPEGVKSLLDVGAGSGQIAFNILKKNTKLRVMGVDTLIRKNIFIPIKSYDGKRIPFKSKSFDVVMAIDVLHHTHDPIKVLKEMARVSHRYILIKDHTANNFYDKNLLKFMDYFGNKLYGVVLPYNYLSKDQWARAFKKNNLEVISEITKLHIYPWPFDLIFGRKLHCLYLLKKKN